MLVGILSSILSSIITFKVQFSSVIHSIPFVATLDARAYLAWTSLGVIFFLRSIHSKLSGVCSAQSSRYTSRVVERVEANTQASLFDFLNQH